MAILAGLIAFIVSLFAGISGGRGLPLSGWGIGSGGFSGGGASGNW
jgi:hypothetical protein